MASAGMRAYNVGLDGAESTEGWVQKLSYWSGVRGESKTFKLLDVQQKRLQY